jgi:phage terminase large subunit-like protein
MASAASSLFQQFPWLLSPAHLGEATYPWWQTPPHLQAFNSALVDVFWGQTQSLMVNMPYQHGKSQLGTRLFVAWWLLLKPDTRFLVVGHEREFSEVHYGMEIKDLFNQWGSHLNMEIREDMRRKGEWKIQGNEGGVVCRGWQGGLTGRPAEVVVIDDLIKGPEQAMSSVIMQAQWRFYMTVIFGRLRNETALVVHGTRWSKADIFGRLLTMAQRTGQQWTHLKFPALARKHDSLGRKEGEPLWPSAVGLDRLQAAKQEFGPWFEAAWQQNPEDAEGAAFKPAGWPRYADIGGAWSVPSPNQGRTFVGYDDAVPFMVVDPASTDKKRSDFTCIGNFAILPDGSLMVLSIRCDRVKLDKLASVVAEEAKRWQPMWTLVESDGFQEALIMEFRRHHEIPECRPARSQGKTKLMRAFPAMQMGENGRILLPDPAVSMDPRMTQDRPGKIPWGWLDDYKHQLTSFTGLDDGHDDMVDVTAYAAQEAIRLRGAARPISHDNGPCILTAGKEMGGW